MAPALHLATIKDQLGNEGWHLQVDTVATTLTLAEQNHAEELKRVCLEFASRNLSTVMGSEGYQHMISSCPQLQVNS